MIPPELSRIIAAADALLVTAGAGMGVDSGLPDFRGNQGFWEAYPPIAKLGLSFSQMANPAWFADDPELAWGFYGHRLQLYRTTGPHEGFQQLLDYGASLAHGFFVFTSNVDGQFQKAGFTDEQIYECHGSIHHWQCSENCRDSIWEADDSMITVDEATFRAATIPRCPHCRAVARPNILMFGDFGFNGGRIAEQQRRFESWLYTLKQVPARLLIIEIGAGHAVPTVRLTSEQITRQLPNASLVRINPRDHDVPAEHFAIPLGGLEGIRKLLAS